MNTLTKQGLLEEIKCGQCFSYVLAKSELFQSTEYKVMQSQTDGVFVSCIKMMFNGRTALFYMPGDLKSLDTLVQWMDAKTLLRVAANLIDSVIKVRENGFLSCGSLMINLDKIYVDKVTQKVSLIYLPVADHSYGSYDTFENEFRAWLISQLKEHEDNEVIQICDRLANPMLTLDEIFGERPTETGGTTVSKRVVFVALNVPKRTEIAITKESFVIGRHPQMADGVIGFSKNLGRKHCRIDISKGRCYITDLESKNFTYVNKRRILPNTPIEIKNGDMIRLADIDFQVEIY